MKKASSDFDIILYIIIPFAICLLIYQIANVWQSYRNKNCLAPVYKDKVLYVLIEPARPESRMPKNWSEEFIVSESRVDKNENICELKLSIDDTKMTVRYRPNTHTSTFSAGRAYTADVRYDIKFVSFKYD